KLLQALEDALPGGGEVTIEEFTKSIPGGSSTHGHSLTSSGSLARSNAKSNTPRAAAPQTPSQKKRLLSDSVLVVDDNATVRAFMEAKLAPYGFDVDFAETGEEAIGLSGGN